MQQQSLPNLFDAQGNPLSPGIVSAITHLLPRLRRSFPPLSDEVLLTNVLDQAARRLAAREAQIGPLEKWHGHAWVALRDAATSQMRRGAVRVLRKTLANDPAANRLALMPGHSDTAEHIERRVLVRELLTLLSPHERLVVTWKARGLTSLEIATKLSRSVVAVDTTLSRIRTKLRRAVTAPAPIAPGPRRMR